MTEEQGSKSTRRETLRIDGLNEIQNRHQRADQPIFTPESNLDSDSQGIRVEIGYERNIPAFPPHRKCAEENYRSKWGLSGRTCVGIFDADNLARYRLDVFHSRDEELSRTLLLVIESSEKKTAPSPEEVRGCDDPLLAQSPY